MKQLITSSIVAATLLFTTSSFAQSSLCGSRDTLVERLKEKYQEEQTYLRIINDDTVVELWENMETETFTFFLTKRNGRSCLGPAGKGPVVLNTTNETVKGDEL